MHWGKVQVPFRRTLITHQCYFLQLFYCLVVDTIMFSRAACCRITNADYVAVNILASNYNWSFDRRNTQLDSRLNVFRSQKRLKPDLFYELNLSQRFRKDSVALEYVISTYHILCFSIHVPEANVSRCRSLDCISRVAVTLGMQKHFYVRNRPNKAFLKLFQFLFSVLQFLFAM